MPIDKFELRISLQKLLIVLILVIAPLSIVGFYLTSRSDRDLTQAVGSHFKTVAETAAMDTSQFVNDRVIDVAAMAVAPAVVDAVAAANQSYQKASDAAIAERIHKLSSSWNTTGGEAAVKGILSSSAARLLRQHREVDPRFLRITVADEKGGTVAATHKPNDYFQGEAEYWQPVYAGGHGAVYVTAPRYDDATRSNYIGIAVPMIAEGSGLWIGAVYALVDISALLQPYQQTKIGSGGRLILAADDGTVVSAPNLSFTNRMKSEEYAAIREALGTLNGRQAGYVLANVSGGSRSVVGFADTGLKQRYGNLGWVVMASEDEREASAPVHPIEQFAFMMLVLGILMVTLLAVYFFLHRRERFEDIDEALHEEGASGAAAGG